MKSTVIAASALTLLLLGGCSGKPAGGEAMSTPSGSSPATPAGGATTQSKSAAATGTVMSIDAAGGMITLTHGPVESLGWPGMTMPFKATPAQIAAVKVGQKVRFEFEAQDMNGTITRIAPEQ